MVKDVIRQAIEKVTQSEDIKLDTPSIPEHGDWATNVALELSKRQKKTPLELANEIVSKLNEDSGLKKVVSKIEIAGPGFINFFLKDEALVGFINQVNSDVGAIHEHSLQEKKIMIEFTDPNPFKEFHIGHLYSNAVGESIARLLESQGATVKRVNYQGDVGMHVAKALWGLLRKMIEDNLSEEGLSQKSLNERIHYFGQAYSLGAIAYEEDKDASKEMKKINKQIFEKDTEVYGLYQKGRQWSLDYFELIYKKLGTKFDYYYFESEVGVYGKELVLQYLKEGIFEESKGAIVFPGEKYGLHTRVFINSEGFPTYEAKELGLAPKKYKDFPYDVSVIITGNEINEYFRVLLKSLELIYPDLAKKTVHLGHGMVRLPEGKMSSRTGKIIAGEDLLSQVSEKIVEISENQNTEVVDQVAVAAVKGSFLQVGIGQDIVFDVESSINTDGNSGPYLQYTYARAASILAKGVIKNETVSDPFGTSDIFFDKKEKRVARVLIHYSEVVQNAAINYSPHILANYLFSLAQEFNSFYSSERVIDHKRESIRLLLTRATAKVIKNGLNLLGIEAPEKM